MPPKKLGRREKLPVQTQETYEAECQRKSGYKPSDYDISLGTNQFYYENFLNVRKLEKKVTRFHNSALTAEIGIEEEVERLFDNLRWKGFLKCHATTINRLTIEMLSTTLRNMNERRELERIQLRVGETFHSITPRDLNRIFGIDDECNGMAHFSYKTEFGAHDFWAQISSPGSSYDPRTAKASRIQNPVLRYAHRVLANTLFARKEIGPIRLDELYLLKGMVTGVKANFGRYMIETINDHLGGAGRYCLIGGLLHYMAIKLGGTITRDVENGKDKFDEAFLIKNGHIGRVNGVVYAKLDTGLKEPKEEPFPLTNLRLFTMTLASNYRMDTEENKQIISDFEKTLLVGGSRRARTTPGRRERGEGSGTQQNEEQVRVPEPEPALHVYSRRPREMTELNRRLDTLQEEIEGVRNYVGGFDFERMQQQQDDGYRMNLAMYNYHLTLQDFTPLDPPPRDFDPYYPPPQ